MPVSGTPVPAPAFTHTGSPNAVPSVFRRVLVDFMIRGTTRVTWEFNRHMKDPSSQIWAYTLQTNQDGALPEDGWVDVGTAQLNVSQLTDSTSRPYGKVRTRAYRVKLVTPVDIYYSPPALTLGALNKFDWLKIQEITRKHELLYRKKTAQGGFLLRRKRDGTPCPKCLDPATGAVTLSKCDICQGTRIQAGYWAAVPLIFCQVEPNETREHITLETGMSQQDVTVGYCTAIPGLNSNDLWVAADSDSRYYIHEVKPLAQIRDVPVILRVGLRTLPADDIAYTISLAGN